MHAVPSDVSAQIFWRIAHSAIVADTAPDEAQAIAREAVQLANATDSLNFQAAAQLAYGTALSHNRERDAAVGAVETALDLYEQKGNAVAAEHAREMVAEVTAV
jgi:hypothetical protein